MVVTLFYQGGRGVTLYYYKYFIRGVDKVTFLRNAHKKTDPYGSVNRFAQAKAEIRQ